MRTDTVIASRKRTSKKMSSSPVISCRSDHGWRSNDSSTKRESWQRRFRRTKAYTAIWYILRHKACLHTEHWLDCIGHQRRRKLDEIGLTWDDIKAQDVRDRARDLKEGEEQESGISLQSKDSLHTLDPTSVFNESKESRSLKISRTQPSIQRHWWTVAGASDVGSGTLGRRNDTLLWDPSYTRQSSGSFRVLSGRITGNISWLTKTSSEIKASNGWCVFFYCHLKT